MKKIIGIADTMFARADMAKLAIKTLQESEYADKIEIKRYAVPGFKDLPVAAKKLIEEQKCDIVLALGMAGKANIDNTCAHEASTGLINVQLMTNKHVLGVFIFENEGKDDRELAEIMKNRTKKHAINALWLLFAPAELEKRAGKGERQGKENENFFDL